MADGEAITVNDLPPEVVERLGGAPVTRPMAAAAAADDDFAAADEPDGARIRAALEKAHWRRGKAAEILAVSPRTLYRWMKRLGL